MHDDEHLFSDLAKPERKRMPKFRTAGEQQRWARKVIAHSIDRTNRTIIKNAKKLLQEKPMASKRKTYTDEQKAKILADANESTIAAASKKHGVSVGSIMNWKGSKPAKQSGGLLNRLASIEARLQKLEKFILG